MKNYKNTTEVPKKYRWNIEKILKDKEPNFYKQKIFKFYKWLIENKNNIFDDAESFNGYLKKSKENAINYNIYANWFYNNMSINVVDSSYKKEFESFSLEFNKLSNQLADWEIIIIKNKKKIDKLLELDKFSYLKRKYDLIFQEKKHILSKEKEEVISELSRGTISVYNFFSTFTDSEMKFEDALDSKNKPHKLTTASYTLLLKSNDEILRKNVERNYWVEYSKYKETLSLFLYNHKLQESTTSKIRKYNSSIEMFLKHDELKIDDIKSLYDSVKKNSHLVNKFKKQWNANFKSKFKRSPKPYDKSVELVKINNKYSIEDSQKIVIDSLKPMGKEYLNVVETAINKKWIDYMPIDNKISGAYSISNTYGINEKLILMNFNGTFSALTTLAHELGHSIHSYFSDANQKIENSSYNISIAEIASIFNELMLNDYLLNKSDSNQFKYYLVEKMLSLFVGTMHRQTLWSNYEYKLYTAIDSDIPLNSFDSLLKIYEETLNEYSGTSKKVKLNNSNKYGSIYVPHYYFNFYVHRYAFGIAGAYAFFNEYKKNGKIAIDNFIKNFLSAGSAKSPLDILKDAGLNPHGTHMYDNAFIVFEELLKEYTRLSKLIFKK